MFAAWMVVRTMGKSAAATAAFATQDDRTTDRTNHMIMSLRGLLPTRIIMFSARRRSKPHFVQASVMMFALSSSTTVALKYVARTVLVSAILKSCAIRMGSSAVTAGATGCMIHQSSIQRRRPIAPRAEESSPPKGISIISANARGPRMMFNVFFIVAFILILPFSHIYRFRISPGITPPAY